VAESGREGLPQEMQVCHGPEEIGQEGNKASMYKTLLWKGQEEFGKAKQAQVKAQGQR